MPRHDVITFDCYGTLIDWENGIVDSFTRAAAADRRALDRTHLLRAYAEAEPAAQTNGFRSYRDVLGDVTQKVAMRLGWPLDPTRADFLARDLPGWRPFSDTNPALERLRTAGFRLGILSNVDDDLLAGTLRHLSVTFDLIVTAPQVRSYKPAHGHFIAARKSLEGQRWLHAAQSYFHDVVPATEMGIPVVWVNRKAEKPSGKARANHEVANLTKLADWVMTNS